MRQDSLTPRKATRPIHWHMAWAARFIEEILMANKVKRVKPGMGGSNAGRGRSEATGDMKEQSKTQRRREDKAEASTPGRPAIETAPGASLPAGTGVDRLTFERPKRWHCLFCGWRCDDSANDYQCRQCSQLRPYVGGSCTMVQCRTCQGFSLALARYCEWCGQAMGEARRLDS